MKSDVNKLKLNMVSSLILQIITVMSGFILPKLILSNYGSDVNGLISSITQFLSLISFLDGGMGIVVQSALYKPLVEGDIEKINLIVSSATKFFKRLAYLLFIYVICLIAFLPNIIKTSFSNQYIIMMILIISIGTFVQYYIGIVDGVILAANQKRYISNWIQCIAVILNTVFSSVFILKGFSIHFVKFITMLIYLIRPLVIHFYICKKYKINRYMRYVEEPISQKWNGIAQHVSAVVLDNTDTVVLSIFDVISTVSIYSVYNLVVTGIRQIILTAGSGLHSYWGSLYAEKEDMKLSNSFNFIEWIFHNLVIVVYGITAFLIVPFVLVYTMGVRDVNYYQPLFAVLLVIAQACRCIRLPYNTLIQSIGHYKQTQSCYIMGTIINILISISAVKRWGLVGVAIGTVFAMLYQLIWMMIYVSKIILHRTFEVIIKQVLVDFIIIIFCTVLCALYGEYTIMSYWNWFKTAIIVVIIWGSGTLMINCLFNRKYSIMLIEKIINRKVKRE